MSAPSALPAAAGAAESGTRAASAGVCAAAPSVRNVWVDCDPGHDDALALILAGFSPQLRILGVSTVAGNQSIAKTTTNALRILQVSGLGHIPVFEGAAKPLMRPAVECEEIHGESGLEGSHFPSLEARAGAAKGFEAMRDAARQCLAAASPLTIIATGPLTNVALLYLTYPELFHPTCISSVVLMGGAVGVGNTGPAAEFNIEHDPEAAALVFEQAARPQGEACSVVMVPLEVTHTALVDDHVLASIRGIGNATAAGQAAAEQQQPSVFATLICDLLLFFREAYTNVFGFRYPPLHDPCAVAYVLHPELFVTRRMRVDVDCQSALCAGRTVCDIYARSTKPANVTVALQMDVPAFWKLIIQALTNANAVSTLNRTDTRNEGTQQSAPAAAAAASATSTQVSGKEPLLVEDGEIAHGAHSAAADVSNRGPLAVRVQNLPPLTAAVQQQ